MIIQYIESEGGMWFHKEVNINNNELESLLKGVQWIGESLSICTDKLDLVAKALKLPDGRILDGYFKKFRHECMGQTFVKLTKIEKAIVALLKSEDKVFYKDEILKVIWGGFISAGILNITMFHIREKIPNLIISTRGKKGYRLNIEEVKKYFLGLGNSGYDTYSSSSTTTI